MKSINCSDIKLGDIIIEIYDGDNYIIKVSEISPNDICGRIIYSPNKIWKLNELFPLWFERDIKHYKLLDLNELESYMMAIEI